MNPSGNSVRWCAGNGATLDFERESRRGHGLSHQLVNRWLAASQHVGSVLNAI